MFSYPDGTDCPQNWEYKHHPAYDPSLLEVIWSRWLQELRQAGVERQRNACYDTREFHREIFENLTPATAAYFAGHYRGESYFCLEEMSVGIPSDPRVGTFPHLVASEMCRLGLAMDQAAAHISFLLANGDYCEPNRAIVKMVYFVANSFVNFLTIHPFANGNGHAARFLLNVMFGSFGFWINRSFPVHRRPSSDYATMIHRFRSGDAAPFVKFLIDCLS